MQPVSHKFQAALERQSKTPVYLVIFGKVNDSDSDTTVPATRYSTHDLNNAAGTTKAWMTTPDGLAAAVTIFEGRSSFSGIGFSLLDKNAEITKLVFRYPMANRRVTVKMGFRDLDEADFITIFRGRVQSYASTDSSSAWRFETVDLYADSKQKIVTAHARLSANIGASLEFVRTSYEGNSTGDFGTAGYVGSVTNEKFWLMIDNEVMGYSSKGDTGFMVSIRGAFGTRAVAHKAGAEVKQFLVLTGNPLELALAILTSTGTSPDGNIPGTNGTYDLLPASCGLAIPQTDIDVEKMEYVGKIWLGGLNLHFMMKEPVVAKEFLENEIYRVVNAYPYPDGQGRLSANVYHAPIATERLLTLDDTNITGAPDWSGNALATTFYNLVTISYDYDFITGKYGTTAVFYDSASRTKYGQVRRLDIESKGLTTTFAGQARVESIGNKIIRRFASPTPTLRVKCFLPAMLCEPGDSVLLTTAYLPDLSRGAAGVESAMMEVLERRVNFSRGEPELILLDTGQSYGPRYGAISPSTAAPSSFPGYLTATVAQRAYSFISAEVGTRAQQSNGDIGYKITD